MTRRRQLLRGALAGAVASLAGGCATEAIERVAEQPLPEPRPRLGDRWRYELINRFNNQRIGEVLAEVEESAPTLRVALRDADGRRLGDELYATPWAILQEPFYAFVQIFSTPIPLLPPSGRAGDARWHESSYRLPGTDLRYCWEVRNAAEGWERLRAPAGEFIVLRVVRDIVFAHPDFTRLRPWRRETLWYAPAIHRWVQREWAGWYLWPGERFPLREDFVRWRLLEHRPAPGA